MCEICGDNFRLTDNMLTLLEIRKLNEEGGVGGRKTQKKHDILVTAIYWEKG